MLNSLHFSSYSHIAFEDNCEYISDFSEMPGIIMFNRRWRISSDDFVFPALSDITVRIFW